MSATMARQKGLVQLEHSDMCLALNMAKLPKGRFWRSTIAEMQYLIKEPCTEAWEENMRVVEFPGQRKMKAEIERHPAMLRQNHMDGCLPCQIGTSKNQRTCWRRKGTVAPPPDRHRQLIPKPTLPLPGMLPVPPTENQGAQSSQIDNFLPRYVYSHAPLPSARFFNLYAYAQDNQHDKDFNPDMLTDDGISTG